MILKFRYSKLELNKFLLLCGFLLGSVSFVFCFWQVQMSRMPFIRFQWQHIDNKVVITKYFHDNLAEKNKMKKGDILIKFADIDITPDKNSIWFWYAYKKNIIQANQFIPIIIEREGTRITTHITPKKINYQQNSMVFLGNLQFLFFIIMGFYVIFKGYDSYFTRMLVFIFLGSAILFGNMYYPDTMLNAIDLIRKIMFRASFFIFPLLLHFSMIYPEKKKLIKQYPLTILFLYIPSLFLFIYDIIQEIYIYFFSDGIWSSWYPPLEWYRTPRFILAILASILFLVIILHSYIKASSEINRRRMEWIVGGSIVGILPILISKVIPFFFRGYFLINEFYSVTIFFLMAIPIPFIISVSFKENM